MALAYDGTFGKTAAKLSRVTDGCLAKKIVESDDKTSVVENRRRPRRVFRNDIDIRRFVVILLLLGGVVAAADMSSE
jgi:hypothetical protein